MTNGPNMSFLWNEFPGPFDLALYDDFDFKIQEPTAGQWTVAATFRGQAIDLTFVDSLVSLPPVGVPVCVIYSEDIDVGVFCGMGWKLLDDDDWLYGVSFWATLPSQGSPLPRPDSRYD